MADPEWVFVGVGFVLVVDVAEDAHQNEKCSETAFGRVDEEFGWELKQTGCVVAGKNFLDFGIEDRPLGVKSGRGFGRECMREVAGCNDGDAAVGFHDLFFDDVTEVKVLLPIEVRVTDGHDGELGQVGEKIEEWNADAVVKRWIADENGFDLIILARLANVVGEVCLAFVFGFGGQVAEFFEVSLVFVTKIDSERVRNNRPVG